MEDLYAALHTWVTNLVGSHPIATGAVALFVFVFRPMMIAFLKDAYPRNTPPTGKSLLALPEVQVILQRPLTTPEAQEWAIDELIKVISPPLIRPPVVAGILSALGIVTNWYRWIFQRIGLTPPSEDVTGSSAEVPLPAKPLPADSVARTVAARPDGGGGG